MRCRTNYNSKSKFCQFLKKIERQEIILNFSKVDRANELIKRKKRKKEMLKTLVARAVCTMYHYRSNSLRVDTIVEARAVTGQTRYRLRLSRLICVRIGGMTSLMYAYVVHIRRASSFFHQPLLFTGPTSRYYITSQ